MKHFIFAFLTIAVFACKKDSNQYSSAYDKSYQEWISYKASVNNSYTYTVTSASIFGASSESKITVQGGKVTGRSYAVYLLNQSTGQNELQKSWEEDQTTLNTHTEGALTLTLDDIYAKAKTEWLTADNKQNDVSFTVDSKGLMESCGYWPKGCQDDCFIGIHIKDIKQLSGY